MLANACQCLSEGQCILTEKLYFDNPLQLEFAAEVQVVNPQSENLYAVELNHTYFYPTGGGQAHDVGWIDGKPVVDVRSKNGGVLHIVQGEIAQGSVACEINQARRYGNMRAHTGQHLLSAAFVRTLEAETVSVKMSAQGPSTVDIHSGDLTAEQIEAVENLANQVIMENRPVKSYFVKPDDSKIDELRRTVKFEKVSGDVRLVEIVDWDLSACAGTHLPATGMLGLLKIIKVENYKGGSRVHFVVGTQALQMFRHYQHVAVETSNMLSSGTDEIVNLVQKLQNERQELNKSVKALRQQLLGYEKVELLASAEKLKDMRLIKKSFDNREADELRLLANSLAEEAQTLVVFANQQGDNVAVLVAASEDAGKQAGKVLRAVLGQFNGRGGGNESYAQGIIKDFDDVQALLRSIANY